MLPHPEPGNNKVGPIKWEAVEFSLFRVSDVAFRVTLWSSFVYRKMKQTVHEALNPEPRTQKPKKNKEPKSLVQKLLVALPGWGGSPEVWCCPRGPQGTLKHDGHVYV